MTSPLQKAKLCYAVYILEIKKRFICVTACSIFTFICAYMHSNCLIYCITSSLQKIDCVKKRERWSKSQEETGSKDSPSAYKDMLCKESTKKFLQPEHSSLANGSQMRNLVSFFKEYSSKEIECVQDYRNPKKETLSGAWRASPWIQLYSSYKAKLCMACKTFCKYFICDIGGGRCTSQSQPLHQLPHQVETLNVLIPGESFAKPSMQSEALQAQPLYGVCELFDHFGDGIDDGSLYDNLCNFEAFHFFNENCCVQGVSKAEKVSLIFTDVHEAFSVTLSVCLFWCFLTLLPFYLYHLFCFLSPTLSLHNTIVRKLCVYLVSGYVLWWYVDVYLLSKILTFFYSFQIQRDAFSITAQTKVYAYLSWYISVFMLFVLIFSTILVFYNQKRAVITNKIHSFSCPSLPRKRFIQISNTPSNKKEERVGNTCVKKKHTFFAQASSITYFDRKFRVQIWWGCLLVAAFLSPPELFSQFVCTVSFILLVEFTLWCAYFSSCRDQKKIEEKKTE